MTRETAARHPRVMAEIEGLAEGLELPLAQVMAWNCRGDLLATAPDGCTTVMLPGAEPVIAHNEDGLPFFRGACLLLDAAPEGEPGFLAFCYPGSIPGHTFAVTRAGVVQAVNNIRLTGVVPRVPRMVLGRAVLASTGRAAALALLRDAPQSGGFHFALGQQGEAELVGVEFGGGAASVRAIETAAVHANHALHLQGGQAPQIVTRSSRDRQARGEALLDAGVRDPLAILRDTGGPGLPIRRDAADDPDEENTLATAVAELREDGVRLRVYDRASGPPALERTFPPIG